ncbi:hypothetical protein NIES4102_34920 [Chondrocystis sp. NIES-4102]|nr:hypothetical protein NIES4102_34920 [Chondrocystis sp. NIES-4102]
MRKLIQVIKSIKLRQILTALLVSSLLLVSTACNQGTLAQGSAGRPASDTYDKYDANQNYEGGMNGYNDDRRYDTETATKTKALIDTARSRQTDDLGEYAEDITNRAQDKLEKAQRDIPRTLENKKDETFQAVEERTRNLQDNLSNAPNEARRIFEGAKNNAQQAIDDAKRASDNTAREFKSNVDDLT